MSPHQNLFKHKQTKNKKNIFAVIKLATWVSLEATGHL